MSLLGQWTNVWPEAGCDEAGRGCFAGPVFAAAVIWPPDLIHPKINDSKQVNKKNRNDLRTFIEENAIAYSVSKIEANEIDKLNILWASVKAMQEAVLKLNVKPNKLTINNLPL